MSTGALRLSADQRISPKKPSKNSQGYVPHVAMPKAGAALPPLHDAPTLAPTRGKSALGKSASSPGLRPAATLTNTPGKPSSKVSTDNKVRTESAAKHPPSGSTICNQESSSPSQDSLCRDQGPSEEVNGSEPCYFKPASFNSFFPSAALPEKPLGPPPLSEAENQLMHAVASCDVPSIERLLQTHGPKLLSGAGGGGITSTAILYAARAGDREICETLVRLGGPEVLAAHDFKGRTAAEYADTAGHSEIAKMLRRLEGQPASSNCIVGGGGALPHGGPKRRTS